MLATKADLDTIAIIRTFDGIEAGGHAGCGNVGVAVYPVIGGVLDFQGGLEAARLFSLLCMLIVTTCVYFMTIQFFDRKSALIAAFLFVCEGPVRRLQPRCSWRWVLCCCEGCLIVDKTIPFRLQKIGIFVN